MANLIEEQIRARFPVLPVPLGEPLARGAETGLLQTRFLVAADGLYKEVVTPWLYACVPVAKNAHGALPFGALTAEVRLTLPTEILLDRLQDFYQLARQQPQWECRQDFLYQEGILQGEEPEFSQVDYTVEHHRPACPLGVWAVDVHSHGPHEAYFSSLDDIDDQHDIKLAVVVGRVASEHPQWTARICLGHGIFVPTLLPLEGAVVPRGAVRKGGPDHDPACITR